MGVEEPFPLKLALLREALEEIDVLFEAKHNEREGKVWTMVHYCSSSTILYLYVPAGDNMWRRTAASCWGVPPRGQATGPSQQGETKETLN
jgi:hypothetical protein